MFEGFSFWIPAEIMTHSVIWLGGCCALVTWVNALTSLGRNGRAELPRGIYPFTAAMFVQLIWITLHNANLRYLPYHTFWHWTLEQAWWVLSLVLTFLLLIISQALVRKGSGFGIWTLKVGSGILLVVFSLGFILMLSI